MNETPPAQHVTRYRMTPGIAERRIRNLAKASDNIAWSVHALQRMNEREIFDVDVLRILREGMVIDPPEETKNRGEWKCKIVFKLRGAREAGAVVIVLRTDRLFVKTVEWEDLS